LPPSLFILAIYMNGILIKGLYVETQPLFQE